MLDGFPMGDAHLTHVTNRVSPVLSWTFADPDGDNQEGYTINVCYGANDTLAWTLTGTGGSTSIAYAGSTLLSGIDYYFRVNASDDSISHLWSGWSPRLDFHVNAPPPVPREPVLPLSGTVILPQSVKVQWTSGGTDHEGDPVSFAYCVDETTPPSSCLIAQGTTGANESVAFAALSGTTYYWRVRAYDGYEYSEWSLIWDFRAQSPHVNTPPSINVADPPARLQEGTAYVISWSMHDDEDANSQLVVYLNYTFTGGTFEIAGPLTGVTVYLWTIPQVEATDISINATVMDSEGSRGWNATIEFEIFRESSPPSDREVNYKSIVALIFAVILAVAGVWSSKKRPWRGGKDRMAVAKAFTFTSLPFVLAEAVTGITSYLTGQLSIPPALGIGTAIDLSILVSGMVIVLARALKSEEKKAEAANVPENR